MEDRPLPTTPSSSLSHVRLGLLSSRDIVSLSVRAINKPLDVTDPSLGLPSIRGTKCSTCGTSVPKQCPGHFGRVELSTPVYHPEHLRKLRHILSLVCLDCGKRRKKKNKSTNEQDDDDDDDKDDATAKQKERDKGKQVVEAAPPPPPPKKQAPPRPAAPVVESYYINLSDEDDSEEDIYIDIMAEPVATKKAGCRFCEGIFKYPNVAVVSMKFQNNRIEGILLTCPGKEIPPGYWSFLGDVKKERRRLKLSPHIALSILKKVPAKISPRVDVEALILETLPVPPNCMQSLLDPRSGAVSVSSGGPIQAMKKIIAENNIRALGNQNALKSKWKTLQHLISQYFRLKGCPKIRNNAEPWVKPNANVKFHDIWKQKVKNTILSKMTQFCAIALLTGDPYLSTEEILVPEEISKEVTVPERVTEFNLDKLQTLVNDLKAGFIEVKGVTSDLRGMSAERRQLELGAVLHRPIRDGDLVFVTRQPAVNKHSVVALTTKIFPGKSFKINPLLCTPLKGDFDGDRLQVYFPQGVDARIETSELMAIKQQFLSLSTGTPVLQLTQDVLVAAYLLVSRPVFFTASQIQQLAVHCDRWSIPESAIAKPRRLWSGIQAFGLLLPPELEFSTKNGVLISDGEILRSGESYSWIRSGSDSLLLAIYDKIGVAEAVRYLDRCCSMLREFLNFEGFSIGLGDFSLRSEQRDAISKLLTYAKRFYSEQQDFREAERGIEEVIKNGTGKNNRLIAMMESGSKGSAAAARSHVGCLGVQIGQGRIEFMEKSFWSGLDRSEFWHHTVAARETLLKPLQMQDRGTMAALLMTHLEDAHVAYDGSVRSRRQLIQFAYGDESAQPGEAVGALAASVVTEYIYDAGHEEFKALLQSNHKEKAAKSSSVLRMKRCDIAGCRCLEKMLLDSKELLQPVQLKDVATMVTIEQNGLNWLCHFTLDSERIDNLNLNLESVRKPTVREGCRSEVVVDCADQGSCLHILATGKLINLKYKLIPELLEIFIRGSEAMRPDIAYDQDELVIKASAPFKQLARLGLDVVDWNRSAPSNVQEIYETLGIEAAREFIFQSLVTKMSPGIRRCHISLLADFATHTGKVLGYTDAGFKEFLSSIGDTAPFQRLAVSELEFAAENGLGDTLESVVAATAWGKRPTIGTGSHFKLTWKMDDPKWIDVDVFEFLSSEESVCKPVTPSIAEGRKKQDGEAGWGAADSDTDAGWGNAADSNAGNGWGSAAETGNNDGGGWGSSSSAAAENVDSGWGSSSAAGDAGWGSNNAKIADNSGWGSGAAADNVDSGWGGADTNTSSGAGWGSNEPTAAADDATGWGAPKSDLEPTSGRDNLVGNVAFNDDSNADDDGWGPEPAKDGVGWGDSSDHEDNATGWNFPPAQDKSAQNETVQQFQEEERPWRKFGPSGANTTPLGPRRRIPGSNSDTGNDAEPAKNDSNDANPDASNETGWNPAPRAGPPIRPGIPPEFGNDDESDHEQDKPKRKFAPTGANTVPLGKRRNFPKCANFENSEELPSTGDGTEDPKKEVAEQDNAWGTPKDTVAEQDDGWGAPKDVEGESGWNAAPEADQGNGWAIMKDGEDKTGWAAVTDSAQAATGDEPPKTNPEKPFQRREPRPPPDPLKKKFWDEVVTVVNEARVILRSYRNGDRLSEEDETIVMEKILAHHPAYDQKAGSGIDFLKVDRPTEFPESSCFFVVRRDGSEVDFSYHKCLEAYVEKNFPENYVAKYVASCRPKDRKEKEDNDNDKVVVVVNADAAETS